MLKANLADEENKNQKSNDQTSGNVVKKDDSSEEEFELSGFDEVAEHEIPSAPIKSKDSAIELDEIELDEDAVLPTEEKIQDDFVSEPLGEVEEAKVNFDDIKTEKSFENETTISLEEISEKENTVASASLEEPVVPNIAKEETLSDAQTEVMAAAAPVETKASPKSDDDYYESDYESSSGKKKMFIIGGAIIIALLIAVYFLFDPFGSSEPVVEEPVIDPVQVQIAAKKKAEAELMSSVQGQLRGQVDPILKLFGQLPGGAKLSMLYVYGDDIEIQVFSTNRTAFAEFRNNLKTSNLFDMFQLKDSRSLRPNADIISTYAVNIQPAEITPGDSAIFFNGAQMDSKIQAIAEQLNIKIKAQSPVSSSGSGDNFTASRLAYSIKGQEKNIISFLTAINSTTLNINLAKFSVAGISKNNIKKREMTGVLELNLIMPK